MKFPKKITDEREENDLLKIGNFSFWLLFSMLAILIVVQVLFATPFQQILGEIIVLVISCIAFVTGCIVKGVWDYYTKPTLKTYLVSGLIGAFLMFVIQVIRLNIKGESITHFIPGIALNMAVIFVLIVLVFAIMGAAVKWKRA